MNLNFRAIEHNLCIVLNTPYIQILADEATAEANGLLCYGYIDKQAGLTYEILSYISYVDGDYTIVKEDKTVSTKVRGESFKDAIIIPIKNKALLKRFEERIQIIEESYYSNDGTEESRKETSIDEFRHPFYPDDVKAILYRDDLKTETPWVRLQYYLGKSNGMDGFMGILLNTPFEPRYDLLAGDKVLLAVMAVENEKLCFIIDTK